MTMTSTHTASMSFLDLHPFVCCCWSPLFFQRNLAMLGKTNNADMEQRKLLLGMKEKYLQDLTEIPNPVFLYDLSQLYDTNLQRQTQFRMDLQDFIGLDTPLSSNFTDSSTKEGNSTTKLTKFDICQVEFDALRAELVSIGSRAASWITQYFIHADSVVVSSPDYFQQMLQTWYTDPCAGTVAKEE
jgi:hypothetical protein